MFRRPRCLSARDRDWYRQTVVDDWRTCAQAHGDAAIAACTQVIEYGGPPPKIRAIAYFNRGAAYHAKGDLDRALADFNEVIRLDPKLAAVAYYNRGLARREKGGTVGANADIAEARELQPGIGQ